MDIEETKRIFKFCYFKGFRKAMKFSEQNKFNKKKKKLTGFGHGGVTEREGETGRLGECDVVRAREHLRRRFLIKKRKTKPTYMVMNFRTISI